jgi:FHS family L-fucose permease-like MFS transporter
MTLHSTPLTERRYVGPFVLITSLFFLWALGVNLNDVLIPHLKNAFQLSDLQSSLIQTAFFGGYFLAAFPAGRLMERVGYKNGVVFGLVLCAAGAFLFIPAAYVLKYWVFLAALFIMACGQAFLEVAANPYITVLGPVESSERRLNLAQSFNGVGAWITPGIGKLFILTAVVYSAAQIKSMSPEQFRAFQLSEASTVKIPYLVITGLLLLVAAITYFSHLPEVREESTEVDASPAKGKLRQALRQRHLVLGTIAQFLYVGAQVGVTSFVIRFAQHSLGGLSPREASDYLGWHLFGFMAGRILGSLIMQRVSPPNLLAWFAGSSAICGVIAVTMAGMAPVWAVVLIGFFHSIMFPTIFALSIKNLGPLTKLGSSFLVMAIIGGAIFPAMMGYISDLTNIQRAFMVPLICYLYVFYFAKSGYKPKAALNVAQTAAAGKAQ